MSSRSKRRPPQRPRQKRPRQRTGSEEDNINHEIPERPNNCFDATVDQLDDNMLAMILGYHRLGDIMLLRCVCKKWRDAAKKTIIPPEEFMVDSLAKNSAMATMATWLPNLQQLSICDLEDDDAPESHKFRDGEDPDEEIAALTAHYIEHNIDIISNFSKLRKLEIAEYPPLNGRYPCFFNFPLLQSLTITHIPLVKWDLGMLAGLPSLRELCCHEGEQLSGNISSLRILKDALEKVNIAYCPNIVGNFMDLADFPRLTCLNLTATAVTGDIRDIGEHDFKLELEYLFLPRTVYGSMGYKFGRISEVTDFFTSIHTHQKRILPLLREYTWKLSPESPDAYAEYVSPRSFEPPFEITFVQAASRLGWRWRSYYGGDYNRITSCEINWLDPEPSSESSDYEGYIEELQSIEADITVFRGYHQPPPEAEYLSVCRIHEDYFGQLLERVTGGIHQPV